MIANLRVYPEYKESGSRWLAAVPVHWEVHNLRTLIQSRNERNRSDLPLLSVAREKGVFVRSLTDEDENYNVIPEDLTNYKVARAGNLVINKMKAWQGSMGIAPCDGIVSPAYFVFDFRIANRAFGQALLRCKPYVAHFGQASDGVRVGQWDLTISGMRQIPVLVPPPDEQDAIVRFLDWARGRIERAIRAKRKLIKLLNEQKQAIIHRAVTRGLDLVPLKSSGIPWLGNIPKRWEVRRLKNIKSPVPNSFVDGPFGSSLKSIHYVQNGYAYIIESGFITSGQFVWKEFKTITKNHFKTIMRSSCFGGDIIIAKIGAYFGMAGILPDLDRPAVVSGNSLKLTVNNQIASNNFVHLALLAARMSGALDQIVNATAQPALSLAAMNNLPIPVPPRNEQELILVQIAGETKKLNTTITLLEREIQLLREYRTRLVADVVTGKLDVREVAKNLLGETEEPPMEFEPEQQIEDEVVTDE